MSAPRIGSWYAVTPGQGEPEYFPGNFRGLCGKDGALKRAQDLSAGGSTQLITRTTGRVTTPVREYQAGRETPRSAAKLLAVSDPVPPPPGPALATVTELPTGQGIRPRPRRRRTRERAVWPGLNLASPPCNGA